MYRIFNKAQEQNIKEPMHIVFSSNGNENIAIACATAYKSIKNNRKFHSLFTPTITNTTTVC